MPQVRFEIPALPSDTPPGELFLTGEHRDWSSDPAGWSFGRTAAGAVLEAELPEGELLSVKVRVRTPSGKILEEGDPWGGRAPAHQAVIREDMTVSLPLAGWQDRRAGQGRPSPSAPPREEFILPAPWGEQPVRLWWPEGATGNLPLLILHDGQKRGPQLCRGELGRGRRRPHSGARRPPGPRRRAAGK
ncbi:hypothetical protein [Deinococcus wulumuqiensis]|uniref:Uncharacterized protein n=1 Tax=Deinococcus wulumuqiensis TaxID=980427 RepID=A0AAV4K379_9DEIO|nr:hypothetical protein [Deinococcus wulumuqiensis]GGI72848.1 hypothetical protein GCM10010914_03520 [Deinococcus wulumuqiensis]GGP28576.1 hypothetical protein GCM10008021_02270 [Deinococcus wulumuqiensis]